MKPEPTSHEREVARHLFNAVRSSTPGGKRSREALDAIADRLAGAREDADTGSYAEGFQFAVELLKERLRVVTEHALMAVPTERRRAKFGAWLELEDPVSGENIYKPLKPTEKTPNCQEDLARLEAAFSHPKFPERMAKSLEKHAKEIMLQEHMAGSEDATAPGLADELWIKLGADRQGFYLAMASARNRIYSLERIRKVLFRNTLPKSPKDDVCGAEYYSKRLQGFVRCNKQPRHTDRYHRAEITGYGSINWPRKLRVKKQRSRARGRK